MVQGRIQGPPYWGAPDMKTNPPSENVRLSSNYIKSADK